MLINHTHRPWLKATLVVSLLSWLFYRLLNPDGLYPHFGGSPLGLTFGIAALGIMIFSALLSVRKKVPALRVGRVSSWVKGHVWFSLMLIPLVIFHSGFGMGGGQTQLLWFLFIVATLTGILGVILQQFLPRIMTNVVPLETIFDQIGPITNQLRYEADLLVSSVCGPLGVALMPPEGVKPALIKEVPPQEGSEKLKKFYLSRIRNNLDPDLPLHSDFFSSVKIQDIFNHFQIFLPASLGPILKRLSEILEERRQLAIQKKLHHWLHGWLIIHVPFSVALLTLTLIHAVMALWY